MPDYVSPLDRVRFEQLMKEYTTIRDQVSSLLFLYSVKFTLVCVCVCVRVFT